MTLSTCNGGQFYWPREGMLLECWRHGNGNYYVRSVWCGFLVFFLEGRLKRYVTLTFKLHKLQSHNLVTVWCLLRLLLLDGMAWHLSVTWLPALSSRDMCGHMPRGVGAPRWRSWRYDNCASQSTTEVTTGAPKSSPFTSIVATSQVQ